MRINHNLPALNTYNRLSSNTTNASKSLEKLSSGLRINRAGDDAAGLAISEKMRGQIRGLDMATKNAQDGISLIQTAEGALNETHSILQRMRELSVQAANDTSTDTDRQALQKEVDQLTKEIDRIAGTTEFNTKKLLNGDLSAAVDAQGSILNSAAIKNLDLRSVQFSPQANAIYLSGGLGFDITGLDGAGTGTVTTSGITVAAGTYTLNELASGINDKLKASTAFSGLTASVVDGKLSILNNHASGEISISSASGSLGEYLGMYGTTKIGQFTEFKTSVELDDYVVGSGGFAITINKSGVEYTVSVSSGTYSGKEEFAAAIRSGISGQAELSGLSVRVEGDKFAFYQTGSGIVSDSSVFTITKVSGGSGTNTVFFDSFAKLGLKVDSQITNEQALMSLSDVDGSSLAVKRGDTIRFNGSVNGKKLNEFTFDVKSESTMKDLLSGLATHLGINKTDVAFENGKITVRGNDGQVNDLEDFSLSIKGNAAFNNRFSNFAEKQDARDAKSNNSLAFQIGANEGQTMGVSVGEMTSDALNLNSVNLGTQQGAANSITVINAALEKVSDQRSSLGAFQNRLEHTINNLGTASENLTASESRIRDVDMAKEMMKYTKDNILAQAAQAMLAQANQQPQGVLQLLR